MAKRIGWRMALVLAFVKRNPGTSMLAAAEYVGPHGSRKYGYNTAIRAGLVATRTSQNPQRRYDLFDPSFLRVRDEAEEPVSPEERCEEHTDCFHHADIGMACAKAT